MSDPTELNYRVEYDQGLGQWRWFAHGPSRNDTSPSYTWADYGYAATRWGAERAARRACRRRLRDLDRMSRTIHKRYTAKETR